MNERQKQIIEAAIILFLKDGVGVSTASIAKAAGVSNGTLFNAFETKQALIDAIYLTAKSGMFNALTYAHGAEYSRVNLRQNWCDYLAWARQKPFHRQVMHLLVDAGLVSEFAKVEIARLAAPHDAWIRDAFAHGKIRGPSVEYITKLIFYQIDLVVAEDLEGDDEALAFQMLCQSIGLSK